MPGLGLGGWTWGLVSQQESPTVALGSPLGETGGSERLVCFTTYALHGLVKFWGFLQGKFIHLENREKRTNFSKCS